MVDLDRFLLNSKDSPEKRNLKITAYLFISMVLLMLLIVMITFLISVKGAEKTLMPDVQRKDIVSALIQLQDKELFPKIQVRYSSDYEKGIIIEQKPIAGSTVKAGRRIDLVVSKGPIIDRVGDYIGQQLDELKIHLQTLFASHRTVLKIKEPVMHKFDSSALGTILAQKPEAGTGISSVTELELVVSRGPRGEFIEVDDFVGLNFIDVISELSSLNIPFVFRIKKRAEGEEAGNVVSQSPDPGSELPYGSVLQLGMTRPERLQSGKIFGVFDYVLPDYPIMIDIRLESVSSDERIELFSMKHPGGPISIPYIVNENSELVLYIFDQEEIRKPPARVSSN